MPRLYSLDTLRGIAVIGIVFWDFFALLAKDLNWYAFRIVGNFPFYGLPPALFFFVSGVSESLSISARRIRGDNPRQIRNHVMSRACILLLAGILLTMVLREPADSWGIFEGIALCSVVAYFLLSYVGLRLLVALLVGVVYLGSLIPPYFSLDMPSVEFLGNEYYVIPNFVQRAFFSGLFPFFPFFSLTLVGAILGKLLVDGKVGSRGLVLGGLAITAAGWLLYLAGFPMEYHQAGNIYSLACIIFCIGASTLALGSLFWLLDAARFGLTAFTPLVDCGRASFAICFWRYPLLYNPLIYFGLGFALSTSTSAILSVALLFLIWLISPAWIRLRERYGLRIF